MFLSRRDSAPPPVEGDRPGLLSRLRRGLHKTRAGITEKLAALVLGRRAIDADLLEEIETVLLTADVGVEATRDIVARLTAQVARRELGDARGARSCWPQATRSGRRLSSSCSTGASGSRSR